MVSSFIQVPAVGDTFDPSKQSVLFDDFTGLNSSTFGDTGWAASNISVNTINGDQSHLGIYSMHTSTSATGLGRISRNGVQHRFGGGAWTLKTLIQFSALSTTAEEYAARLGFYDTHSTGADAVDGVYFEYSRATTFASPTGNTVNGSAVLTGLSSTAGLVAGMPVSGTGVAAGATILSVDSASQITLSANCTADGTGITFTILQGDLWVMKSANNSVRTSTMTSVAVTAGAWINLKVIVNANGTQADFYINGNYAGSITQNIPVNSSRETSEGASILKSNGTTARYMHMDYWYRKVVFTTER